MELVVLSRLYNRSIVVYNELAKQNTQVQEQVFPSFEDEEKGSVVDKLTNPVSLHFGALMQTFMCYFQPSRSYWLISMATIMIVSILFNIWTISHSVKVLSVLNCWIG